MIQFLIKLVVHRLGSFRINVIQVVLTSEKVSILLLKDCTIDKKTFQNKNKTCSKSPYTDDKINIRGKQEFGKTKKNKLDTNSTASKAESLQWKK